MKLNATIDSKFDEIGMTEAQKTMVGLHLLTIFSAAIGHRPFVVDGASTYGNLCMVHVGEAGIGKGVSCNFAKEIFSALGEDIVAPVLEASSITSRKTLIRGIHEILSEERRAYRGEIRLYHINEEFASELRAAASLYQSGLSGALCKIIDGTRISERFGRQNIDYPLIHYSFTGHIQPVELSRAIREHVITCGLASRLLWIPVPSEMSAPLPRMPQEVKTELEDEIKTSIIAAASRREVPMSEDAKTEYGQFLTGVSEKLATVSDVMQNILPRFGQHTLKIALVLTMLRRETEVTQSAMKEAIELVDSTGNTVERWFVQRPQSRLTVEADTLATIRGAGKIDPHSLIQTLMLRWKLSAIRRAIRELESAGMIQLRAQLNEDGNCPRQYSVCSEVA